MAEIKIKIEGLDTLKKNIAQSPQIVHQELSNFVKTTVNMIRPMMRREVPFASGKLSQNIQSKSNGLQGEVGPNLSAVPYAIFVHSGTKPHEIRPTTKKALYWKGALHPVKVVRHPGTKPNKFVDRTASEAEKMVPRILNTFIENITNRLTK